MSYEEIVEEMILRLLKQYHITHKQLETIAGNDIISPRAKLALYEALVAYAYVLEPCFDIISKLEGDDKVTISLVAHFKELLSQKTKDTVEKVRADIESAYGQDCESLIEEIYGPSTKVKS